MPMISASRHEVRDSAGPAAGAGGVIDGVVVRVMKGCLCSSLWSGGRCWSSLRELTHLLLSSSLRTQMTHAEVTTGEPICLPSGVRAVWVTSQTKYLRSAVCGAPWIGSSRQVGAVRSLGPTCSQTFARIVHAACERPRRLDAPVDCPLPASLAAFSRASLPGWCCWRSSSLLRGLSRRS